MVEISEETLRRIQRVIRERYESRQRCERLAQRVEQLEAELEATKRERTEASK